MLASLPAGAQQDDGSGTRGLRRLAGPTRVATALAVSRDAFPSAEAVLLARADVYADALAGAPLAGSLEAPVLLTGPDDLDAGVAEEIDRLGAGTAYLLGGPAALSSQVEADLARTGVEEIVRLAGADRFATAAAVAENLDGARVYITEGANADPSRGWPDAVAVSALAAAQRRPILLVTRDAVPGATMEALTRFGTTHATVVGGPAAVSQEVVEQLVEAGLEIDRVAGATRYETSRAVAQRALEAGIDSATTWFVTGRNFPDTLVAGPAAATSGGTLLLLDGQGLEGSPPAGDWVADRAVRRIILVGGTAAISAAVEDELRDALGGGAGGPADEALQRLTTVAQGDITVEMEGGIPVLLRADVAVPGTARRGDAVERAVAFLEEYRGLYGLASPDGTLHLSHHAVDGQGWQYLSFGQHDQRGIPVVGSQLVVVLVGDRFRGSNGRWIPQLPTHLEPVVPPAEAVTASLQAVPDAQQVTGAPQLVYFRPSDYELPDEDVHLAWLTWIADSRAGWWKVVVDALDGTVLLAFSETPEALDLDIFNAEGDPPAAWCWNLENVDNRYDEDGPVDGYRPGGDPDADAANVLARERYSYYRSTFGRRSWDGDDEQIEVVVNVNHQPNPNASYSGGCDHIRFDPGWVVDDVFAHEFGHAVDYHSKDLEYVRQSGALDESYADVFGVLADPEDWLWGEDLPVGAQRDISDPPAFGDPDRFSSYVPLPTDNDFGGVHTYSGIANKAAYLIWDGDTHNGIRTSGIGADKLQQLYYHTLTRRMTPNARMADQQRVSVATAADWAETGRHGFGPRDLCDVRNGFAAVELGEADRDCDGALDIDDSDDDADLIPDVRDNCPTVRNASQADLDRDGIGDACDDDTDGDGVPDGTDNCLRTPNPGQADPDGDGIGSACSDVDGDGRIDGEDNCPLDYNPRQDDLDGDGIGDTCDADRDGDGRHNADDNCADTPNRGQQDRDGDGHGDACDTCPDLSHPDNGDLDGDGLGNPCDSDTDGDGVPDDLDVCPLAADPEQIDVDGDGQGNACDEDDVTGPTGRGAGFLRLVDPHQAIRIRFNPCFADGCPDWLPEDFLTVLGVRLPDRWVTRVVDHTGAVVARGEPRPGGPEGGQVTTLRFSLRPDTFYTSPVSQQRWRFRGHFLELLPPPGAPAGQRVPISYSTAAGSAEDGVEPPDVPALRTGGTPVDPCAQNPSAPGCPQQPDQPPTATITQPGDGAQVQAVASDQQGAYATVQLEGRGTDPEDGQLGGAALVWTTTADEDGDGVATTRQLGTGVATSARLYASGCGTEHTVRLAVTDAAGHTASAAVRIFVVALC